MASKKKRSSRSSRKSPLLAARTKRVERELRYRPALTRARQKMMDAMTAADRRGYTGLVGSKGGLFDDPDVKAAMKAYDRLIVKVGISLGA